MNSNLTKSIICTPFLKRKNKMHLKKKFRAENICRPCVAIIVLNWNGWQDTIECLESVQNLNFFNYQIILIDNGSTDDSLEKLCDWMNGKIQIKSRFLKFNSENKPIQYVNYSKAKALAGGSENLDARLQRILPNRRIVFIKIGENLGFAGGSNVGINYAIKRRFDYVFLLNNDTVIARDALGSLVSQMQIRPQIGVITPQIHYYDDPTRIANAGGYLTITGHRKYYSQNKICTTKFNKSLTTVTFVTGCALMIRREIIEKYGPLSQDFFFGEEDYEFSLRMKKHRIKMACLNNAYVYHKVSRSSCKFFRKKDSIFVYYLNRFIDLKKVYPHGYWDFWRYIVFLYILPMLYIKHHFRLKFLINLTKKIIKYSKKFDNVTNEVIKEVKMEGL